MSFAYYLLAAAAYLMITANCASISDNSVYETPRINNGDQLVSAVINDCLDGSTMTCLKGKVLTYLDSILNLNTENGRSYESKNVDEVIFDRVARVLETNEFKVQLPETVFQKAIVSYRADQGLDITLPEEAAAEARGHLLKKKLLFPILLLLKLKMKALLPIFVAIIGLKALKALVLAKLAISIVLGFVIFQLVKKTGLGAPMAMTPMTESPMTAYGAPAPTTAPSSSYDPSSWEPSSSGGPYSRVWEPSSSASAQNLAYSSYYPSSSSSSSSGSGSSSSSVVPSTSGSVSHSSYSS